MKMTNDGICFHSLENFIHILTGKHCINIHGSILTKNIQFAIDPRPRLIGRIRCDLNTISIGIRKIDCFGYAVITGALNRDFMIDEMLDEFG